MPTTAKQPPVNCDKENSQQSKNPAINCGAKYNTDLTVHAPEPMIVTPFYVVVSIGMMCESRPNGQMFRVGNNYCAACVPVVAPDFETAGKGDCQYCKYDGYYERFHFSTPFVFFVSCELSFGFPSVLSIRKARCFTALFGFTAGCASLV